MRTDHHGVCAVLTLGILTATMPLAHAQEDNPGTQAGKRIISGLLSTGGYFFTSNSGRAAFGDSYFYSETNIYGRPKLTNNLEVSGGLGIVNISSKFFPFSGGSQLTLIGPSFRLATKREIGKPRPYLDGGLYYGSLRSDNLAIDKSAFVPGLSIGVEYPFNKDFTLSAGYRFQGEIGGIDTNGFMVMLRIF